MCSLRWITQRRCFSHLYLCSVRLKYERESVQFVVADLLNRALKPIPTTIATKKVILYYPKYLKRTINIYKSERTYTICRDSLWHCYLFTLTNDSLWVSLLDIFFMLNEYDAIYFFSHSSSACSMYLFNSFLFHSTTMIRFKLNSRSWNAISTEYIDQLDNMMMIKLAVTFGYEFPFHRERLESYNIDNCMKCLCEILTVTVWRLLFFRLTLFSYFKVILLLLAMLFVS